MHRGDAPLEAAEPWSADKGPPTDEDRMRQIYEAHSEALLGMLLGVVRGDRSAAEDLLQETMIRAWRNLAALHTDLAALRPWLWTVAKRIAIDRHRFQSIRPPEETDTDQTAQAPTTDDAFEQVLDRDLIRGLMAELSAAHRAAVVQVFLLDRSTRQAAMVLDIPEGTVRSRLHYALRAARSRPS